MVYILTDGDLVVSYWYYSILLKKSYSKRATTFNRLYITTTKKVYTKKYVQKYHKRERDRIAMVVEPNKKKILIYQRSDAEEHHFSATKIQKYKTKQKTFNSPHLICPSSVLSLSKLESQVSSSIDDQNKRIIIMLYLHFEFWVWDKKFVFFLIFF